jgi:signal transduction histidine kinase
MLDTIILGTLRLLCIGLAAIAVFVAVMGWATKIDRSLPYFGLTVVLLCGFAGVDLWYSIPPHVNHMPLRMGIIQHSLFCLVPGAFLKYLEVSTGQSIFRATAAIFVVLGCMLVPLFLGGAMLHSVDGTVYPMPMYRFLLAPFVAAAIVMILSEMVLGLVRGSAEARRFLGFHLLGCCLLAACGTIDISQMLWGHFWPFVLAYNHIPNFSVIGVQAMGYLMVGVAMKRILNLVRSRQAYVLKLETAYEELSQARSLVRIGQGVSVVCHEIKNQAFALGGSVGVLREAVEFDKSLTPSVDRIALIAGRIHSFCADLSAPTRVTSLGDKQCIDLPALISSTIARNFQSEAERFSIDGGGAALNVNADAGRLEQVFVNLFKNALEAGASRVHVWLRAVNNLYLLTVEDDGHGVKELQYAKLFSLFRTAKSTGSGLGLAISRSIIESHGGSLSAIPTCLTADNHRGMKFNICLPQLSSETMADAGSIALCHEGIGGIAEQIATTIRNVGFIAERVTPEDARVRLTAAHGVFCSSALAGQIAKAGLRALPVVGVVEKSGLPLGSCTATKYDNAFVDEEMIADLMVG